MLYTMNTSLKNQINNNMSEKYYNEANGIIKIIFI